MKGDNAGLKRHRELMKTDPEYRAVVVHSMKEGHKKNARSRKWRKTHAKNRMKSVTVASPVAVKVPPSPPMSMAEMALLLEKNGVAKKSILDVLIAVYR